VGVPGTVADITLFTLLVAVFPILVTLNIENVYVVFLVNPVIVIIFAFAVRFAAVTFIVVDPGDTNKV
jgi:hypothetical protein